MGLISKQPKDNAVLSTAELRRRGDLCAVDGALYDLSGFAPSHPGGSTVLSGCGGADVSALFHSMHTGRDPLKSALLQSHRVGKYSPLAGEFPALPDYKYDSPFAKDLQARVRTVMGTTSWYAPRQFWARTVAILGLTILAELYWIMTGTWAWGLAIGILHAMIGLAVQHDASHGAIDRRPWVNELFAHGADWIGSSRWIWFQQHIMWHHPFTNDVGLDGDASSAEPMLLFHDYTKPNPASVQSLAPDASWWHRFQHLYMHIVLAFYGPSITWNPLYLTTMRHNSNMPDSLFSPDGFFMRKRPLACLLRLSYVTRIILLPWYFSGVPLYVGALFPVTVCGAILTFVFVVSHNFEDSDRAPSKDGNSQIDWYKAQIETSCSYGGNFAMFFTGGLNLQIEHHCFPRLSSWYYPAIQRAVMECCEDHGVKYKCYPDLWSNLRATWRYMRTVGLAKVLSQARED